MYVNSIGKFIFGYVFIFLDGLYNSMWKWFSFVFIKIGKIVRFVLSLFYVFRLFLM